MTRFDYSLKVLATNLPTNVSKILDAVKEKGPIKVKKLWLIFGHLLEKIGRLFISTYGHTGRVVPISKQPKKIDFVENFPPSRVCPFAESYLTTLW